jgi:hypothetical protein
MTIARDISSLGGQRALVEAKMREFEGLRMIGHKDAAEKCREDAHSLLDSWFDAQGEMAEHLRAGKYL